MAEDDGHRFDLVVLKQFRMGGVPPGDVVLLHVFLAFFLEQVGYGHDLHAVLVRDGFAVGTGDAAQSDDADAQVRHG